MISPHGVSTYKPSSYENPHEDFTTPVRRPTIRGVNCMAKQKRDHGDGGIDARGPDRWRLRWRVDGKRFAKSFHGSIRDARRELRRLVKSADDGQHVAPDKLTLSAWVDRWIALQSRGGTDLARRGL